jgi:serine/threonine protein kinase
MSGLSREASTSSSTRRDFLHGFWSRSSAIAPHSNKQPPVDDMPSIVSARPIFKGTYQSNKLVVPPPPPPPPPGDCEDVTPCISNRKQPDLSPDSSFQPYGDTSRLHRRAPLPAAAGAFPTHRRGLTLSPTMDDQKPAAPCASPATERRPTTLGGERIASWVGPYGVVRVVGHGSFGTIYQAMRRRSDQTEQTVALKCLDAQAPALRTLIRNRRLLQGDVHDINHHDVMRQLRREVQCLVACQASPNILHIFNVMQSPRFLFIVTEFAMGGDAARLLRRHGGRLPLGTVRTIITGLLRAVAYMHQHRIAHMDIKPENVLLMVPAAGPCSDCRHAGGTPHHNPGVATPLRVGDIRLCDFGLCAQVPRNSTTIVPPVGTPGFMAPELLLQSVNDDDDASPLVDPRVADMWSVGVTLLELVGSLVPEWHPAYEYYKFAERDRFMKRITWCLKYYRQVPWDNLYLMDLVHQIMVLTGGGPPSVVGARISARAALRHDWLKSMQSC